MDAVVWDDDDNEVVMDGSNDAGAICVAGERVAGEGTSGVSPVKIVAATLFDILHS